MTGGPDRKRNALKRSLRLLDKDLARRRAVAGDPMAPRLVKGTHGQE